MVSFDLWHIGSRFNGCPENRPLLSEKPSRTELQRNFMILNKNCNKEEENAMNQTNHGCGSHGKSNKTLFLLYKFFHHQ